MDLNVSRTSAIHTIAVQFFANSFIQVLNYLYLKLDKYFYSYNIYSFFSPGGKRTRSFLDEIVH